MSTSPELENWKEVSDRFKGGSDSVQVGIGQATQNLVLGIVNLQAAIRGPLVQVWKKFEDRMGYCYILTYTTGKYKDAVVEEAKKASVEEFPILSFIPFEGNAELVKLIDETLF